MHDREFRLFGDFTRIFETFWDFLNLSNLKNCMNSMKYFMKNMKYFMEKMKYYGQDEYFMDKMK